MKLTSEMIKEKAAELGIDCIAIGNIERFRFYEEAKTAYAIIATGERRCMPISCSKRALYKRKNGRRINFSDDPAVLLL